MAVAQIGYFNIHLQDLKAKILLLSNDMWADAFAGTRLIL